MELELKWQYFLAAGAVLLSSAQAWSLVGLPIKDYHDLFWYGLSVRGAFSQGENSVDNLTQSNLTAAYTLNNGLSFSLSLPVVIVDPDPPVSIVTGMPATAPRIGGGFINRPEVDLFFRLSGDTLNYLAISLGAGLPLQTDPNAQNSAFASWVVATGIYGRVDQGWFAFEGRIINDSTIANTITRGSANYYLDSTNRIAFNGTFYFYPTPNFAPFVGYNETFPSRADTGTDNGPYTLIVASPRTDRTRALSSGIEWVPLKYVPTLLRFEFNYTFYTGTARSATSVLTGNLRWLF